MKAAILQEQVSFIARQLSKPYRVAYESQLPALLSGERHIAFLTPLAGFPTRST